METATISPAVPADIPSINRLVNSAYRGESATKGWTHEAHLIEGSLRTDEPTLMELITKPGSVILKYMDSDKILGSVHLENKGEKLYLGMLTVSPESQAGGIGRKLLRAAEEHARKEGLGAITMTVISVRKELIGWYERNGYQPTGEHQPFPNDPRFGTPRQKIEFIVLEKQIK